MPEPTAEPGQQATNGAAPPADPAAPAPPATDPTSADLQAQARAAVEAAATPAPKPEAPAAPGESDKDKIQRLAVQYGKAEQKLRQYEKQTLPDLQAQADAHAKLLTRLGDPNERYTVMEEHGGDYREYAERTLAADKPPLTPEQKELAELKATVAALTEKDKIATEEQAKAAQQAQYRQDLGVAQTIIAEDERFAFTRATSQADAVVKEFNKQTSEGLQATGESAALAVEENLTKAMQPQLEALSKVPRFQEIMAQHGFTYNGAAPATPPVDPAPNTLAQQATAQGAPNPQTAAAPMPTLNNGLSAEPAEPFEYKGKSEQELKMNARRVANQIAAQQAEKRGLQG